MALLNGQTSTDVIERRRQAMRAMLAILAPAPVAAMQSTTCESRGTRAAGDEKIRSDVPRDGATNSPDGHEISGHGSCFPAFFFWLPALCRHLTLLAAHGQLHPLRARQALAA